MASTLHEFTRLLDARTLPRVLEVSVGIYCHDCVGECCRYSRLGQECTLSTGDLLKVIQISIFRFTALCSSNTHIQLPVEYPGLFSLVADSQPYSSVQEILDAVRIEPHRLAQPVFVNDLDIHLPQGDVLHQGDIFRITSVTPQHEGGWVECELIQVGLMPHNHAKEKPRLLKLNFILSINQRGCFMECQDQQLYTLREIADYKISKGRTRIVTEVKKKPNNVDLSSSLLENVFGELFLTPVYQMKAISILRKDFLLISSDLDIEVLDVTDHAEFHPLSLSDIFLYSQDIFPLVAKLHHQNSKSRLSPELGSIFRTKTIIIHRAFHSKRILASETTRDSTMRHFLIPECYNGRFNRRPREFSRVCDLERARSQTENIHVVATRDCDSGYAGFDSVHAGDEFIITKERRSSRSWKKTEKPGEVFECLRVSKKSEAKETVRIPACLEGGFIELVKDKRQYSIAEICHWFPLPFNVTVSMRDLSLAEDLLAGVSSLQIEEEIWDPSLLVSDSDASRFMEMSVNCTDLVLKIKQRWDGESSMFNVKSTINQIPEDSYNKLRRIYHVASITPPPRPPKKTQDPPPRPPKTLSSTKSESVNGESTASSPQTLCVELFKSKKIPISPVTLPRLPQLKASPKGRSLDDLPKEKTEDDENDGHDYEHIDEVHLKNIRRTCQEPQNNLRGISNNTI